MSKYDTDLSVIDPGKENPALVYIRSLNSPVSQQTQRDALNKIARYILKIEDEEYIARGRQSNKEGRLRIDDAFTFPWESLRYEHTSAIQTWLTNTYKPVTAHRFVADICKF